MRCVGKGNSGMQASPRPSCNLGGPPLEVEPPPRMERKDPLEPVANGEAGEGGEGEGRAEGVEEGQEAGQDLLLPFARSVREGTQPQRELRSKVGMGGKRGSPADVAVGDVEAGVGEEVDGPGPRHREEAAQTRQKPLVPSRAPID